MAKKVRGARSTHKPGGLGPTRARRTPDAATPERVGARRPADIDRAVDSVTMEPTELVLSEGTTLASSERKPRRGARTRADSLQARVAAENVYVAEDLRRIGQLTVLLVAALLIAWLMLVPLDLAGLY